jgi:putative membrane protein
MNKLILASMLVLGISACKKNDDNNNTTTSTLNGTDKDFMNKVTYSNLGEIDAGNIAKQRGMHAVIVDFGNMMVTDHGMAHNELSDIAQNNNYTLPAETDQEHKDMATMLMTLSGDAFDSTYIYKMVEGHDKTITILQNEISNGQNASVKTYANNKLPIVQHHRHMADSIANALYP